MKTLITQVGTYLTGDAIADAVLKYWLALAHEHHADVVDVPIVTTDGEPSRVRLALSGLSPIAVVDSNRPDEHTDEIAVAHLAARARAVTPRGSATFSPEEVEDANLEAHYWYGADLQPPPADDRFG